MFNNARSRIVSLAMASASSMAAYLGVMAARPSTERSPVSVVRTGRRGWTKPRGRTPKREGERDVARRKFEECQVKGLTNWQWNQWYRDTVATPGHDVPVDPYRSMTKESRYGAARG